MNTNALREMLCSNGSISLIVVAILVVFAAKRFQRDIKQDRFSGEEPALWAILEYAMQIFLIISISSGGLDLFLGENLSNTTTPDPNIGSHTQSLSETLKAGDGIVVVDAPKGLLKWKDASHETRYNGSAADGDTGRILGTAIYEGYLMRRVEWCNGEVNWVAEKSLDGTEIYLKKR